MSLRNTITSWLGAWKYVLILALLLALSLWGNLHQYVASKTAPLRQEVSELREASKITSDIARQSQTDSAGIFDELRGIVERSRQTRNVYRDAAEQAPLAANCAPGQARMDAVNAGADP